MGFRSRDVIGKRIVRVKLNRFSTGRTGWTFNPVFVLEDGSELCFVVDETEVDCYGITPVLRKRKEP